MRSIVPLVWMALAMAAAAPAASRAQSSFAFSIGSGGHCHGHHHCPPRGFSFGYGFGPVWAPAYYAPPAVVYAAPPPPVVKERVIYVPQAAPPAAPAYSPYAPTSSRSAAATVAADQAPALNANHAGDDRIVIRNAAGAQLPVAFVVDGQDVELNDGSTRTFVGKTHRVVQYDRGGRFGSTQQDLTGGQYEFRVTASGWDLVRRPDVASSSRTAIRANALPESAVAR